MLRSQFSSFKHHVDNFVENSVFLFLQLPKTLFHIGGVLIFRKKVIADAGDFHTADHPCGRDGLSRPDCSGTCFRPPDRRFCTALHRDIMANIRRCIPSPRLGRRRISPGSRNGTCSSGSVGRRFPLRRNPSGEISSAARRTGTSSSGKAACSGESFTTEVLLKSSLDTGSRRTAPTWIFTSSSSGC